MQSLRMLSQIQLVRRANSCSPLYIVASRFWLSCTVCVAVTKPHVIAFGKWISAKWPNATGDKMLDLKVRALFVDTR